MFVTILDDDPMKILRINTDHIMNVYPVHANDGLGGFAYLECAASADGLYYQIRLAEPQARAFFEWWDSQATIITVPAAAPPDDRAYRYIKSARDMGALLYDMTRNETGDLEWEIHRTDLNPSLLFSVSYLSEHFTIVHPSWMAHNAKVIAGIEGTSFYIVEVFGPPLNWKAVGVPKDWVAHREKSR